MQPDDEPAMPDEQARARAMEVLFGPDGPYSLRRVHEVPYGYDGWLIFAAFPYVRLGACDWVAVHPTSGEARYLGRYGE